MYTPPQRPYSFALSELYHLAIFAYRLALIALLQHRLLILEEAYRPLNLGLITPFLLALRLAEHVWVA